MFKQPEEVSGHYPNMQLIRHQCQRTQCKPSILNNKRQQEQYRINFCHHHQRQWYKHKLLILCSPHQQRRHHHCNQEHIMIEPITPLLHEQWHCRQQRQHCKQKHFPLSPFPSKHIKCSQYTKGQYRPSNNPQPLNTSINGFHILLIPKQLHKRVSHVTCTWRMPPNWCSLHCMIKLSIWQVLRLIRVSNSISRPPFSP